MFDSLTKSGGEGGSKRLALSFGFSALGYGGLVAVALVLGGAAKHVVEEQGLDVVFRPPEPPPPPPPPPVAAPPPSAPMVSAPKHLKRKVVDTPPPPPTMAVRAVVPDAPAPEADAKDDAVAAAPPGEGDAAGLEGGTGDTPGTKMASLGPPPPPVARPRPVQLPENATPPQPDPGNRPPEFPAEMRAAGKGDVVILKVVITERGTVEQIKVMKGSEPFVSAALAAVRSWKFSPAIHEGRPIPVFKIVKIPFQLKL